MILSKVYEDAERKLERNEIALGEFERLVDIEVIEPKRGKWIWQSSMAGSFIERRYRCSNCQYEITTQREEPIYNFCPNCGARMKGADDE